MFSCWCDALRKRATRLVLTVVIALMPAAGAIAVDSLPTRAERIKKAQHITEQIRLLSDVLPIPKPSDDAWVEAERAAIKNDFTNPRFIKLYESPESQHRLLYDHLRTIHKSLECIINSSGDLRREIYCWSVTSHYLSERSRWLDGIRILHAAGRLPADLTSRAKVNDLDSFELYHWVLARDIQESIVLPYLRGDLK
jgi:hypothetical protein